MSKRKITHIANDTLEALKAKKCENCTFGIEYLKNYRKRKTFYRFVSLFATSRFVWYHPRPDRSVNKGTQYGIGRILASLHGKYEVEYNVSACRSWVCWRSVGRMRGTTRHGASR